MIEREESRRIRREIRGVLLSVWDPIGIKDELNAQDEYDDYLGHIFELLTQQKSDEAIADYLFSVVKERMGLTGAKRQDMLPTVRALRSIGLVALK
jgi:hypothetical protein